MSVYHLNKTWLEKIYLYQAISVYQNDSSLVNIDELFLSDNEEYCQDDIDYLLKSSNL